MIKSLIKSLLLSFDPPKTGDSFFADPHDFMCERNSERIFYGIIDRHGHTQWNFVIENNTYRFTVINSGMPYYVCDVEILASRVGDPRIKTWLKRSYPRRILKQDFHRLISQGRMVRTESESLFK